MHYTLPVIAVNMGTVARDNSRAFNKQFGTFHPNQGVATTDYIPMPVPVNVTVNMSLLTKFQTDMDQLLSNFIPYNNPYIVISWKVPSAFVQVAQEIRTEVLWNENISMQYPTDLPAETPFRVVADTSFTIKGWLFKKHTEPANNIFEVITNLYPVSGFEIA